MAHRAAFAGVLLATPALVLAQSNPHDVPDDEAAFVQQAPTEAAREQIAVPQQIDNSSKVYFPDEITPQSVAAARADAAEQQQLEERRADNPALSQVSVSGEGAREVDQLSDGESARALAQLSDAERRVLIEAVEGTDICERGSDIPALQALCESRLETRSAEFSQGRGNSAEDSLLGGGLDADRVATLEAAINRLAQSSADSGNFENQVIASVALNNQTLSDSQATEGDPTSELSAETQAVVNAIVQQLSGG